jgi:hypothetical protein
MQRDILKSGGLCRERDHVKFAYMKPEKAQLPVAVVCKTLDVSRAGLLRLARAARFETGAGGPPVGGAGAHCASGGATEARASCASCGRSRCTSTQSDHAPDARRALGAARAPPRTAAGR